MTETAAADAKKAPRSSNLSPVEKAAYSVAMRDAGKKAARERHVAEGKKAARAKKIKEFYANRTKEAAIAKWKAGKMAERAMAKRAGAGTVADQVAAG